MLSRLSSLFLAVMVLVVGTVQAKPFSMRRVDYFNNLRQMLPRDLDSSLVPYGTASGQIRSDSHAYNAHLNELTDNGQLYGGPPQAGGAAGNSDDFDGYGPTGAKRGAHLLRLANQAARGFGKK